VQDRVLNPAASSVSAAFLLGCWDIPRSRGGVLLMWASVLHANCDLVEKGFDRLWLSS
jgi:hypothetical protein